MGKGMSSFSIGQLAKKLNLTTEAIRFYEKRGLLPKAQRSQSNYRIFGEETERSLRFIIYLRDFGFSLEEIKNILKIDPKKEKYQEKYCQLLKDKSVEIKDQIKALQERSDYLDEFVEYSIKDPQRIDQSEFSKYFKFKK